MSSNILDHSAEPQISMDPADVTNAVDSMKPAEAMKSQSINPRLKKTVVRLEKDVLSIVGSVHFETVRTICEQGLGLMSSIKQVVVDLEKLEYCDSSLLALFITWMRKMQRDKKPLVFINLPSFVQDLIRVHGLDAILPIRVV